MRGSRDRATWSRPPRPGLATSRVPDASAVGSMAMAPSPPLPGVGAVLLIVRQTAAGRPRNAGSPQLVRRPIRLARPRSRLLEGAGHGVFQGQGAALGEGAGSGLAGAFEGGEQPVVPG